MNKIIRMSLCGAVVLGVLIGCQKPASQDKPAQEPEGEAPVIEESFERGDTGALTSKSEEQADPEEEPRDDSQ